MIKRCYLEAEYDLNRPMANCHSLFAELKTAVPDPAHDPGSRLLSKQWGQALGMSCTWGVRETQTAALLLRATCFPKQMQADEFAELQGVVLDFLKRSEGHRVTLLLRAPGHQPNSLTLTRHLHTLCVVCSAALPFP